MSKPKEKVAKKPVADNSASKKKTGLELLGEIGTGKIKCSCVTAASGIEAAFRDDTEACLEYARGIGTQGLLQAFWADSGSSTMTSLPPPHGFLGHLIGAKCPGIGGVHDGEEGGARPFLLAA